MHTSRHMRRVIAAGLLTLYLPSCTSWQLGYLSPAEMLTEVVRVTTTDGKEIALANPWVSGDSLVAGRRNAWGTADQDTIAIALAAVRTIQIGRYKGMLEADRTIPAAMAHTKPKLVRVTTATGELRLDQPWVAGDTLLGFRAGARSGARDTVRVAFAGIRRLEMRTDDDRATLVLVGVTVLAVTGVVLAARCKAFDCLR